MGFVQNISIAFVATICCFVGCNHSHFESINVQSYTSKSFVKSIEQGILDSKKEINLYYMDDIKDLKAKLQDEVPKILKDDYFCNKLLSNIDVKYSSKNGRSHIKINLIYNKNVKLPIFVAENSEQIMDALINGWISHRGKVTVIIYKKKYSENQLFSFIDTAEINSAFIPCEAKQVLYEEFPKEGDWQIVNMWLEFPVDDNELSKKQVELKNKINKYSKFVKSMKLKNDIDNYKVIYDIVRNAATYDQSIAILSKANRLSSDTYLDRSAYGALVTGKTVCNGYSRAFKAICDNIGLPCWVVSGTKDGVKHTWNIVVLNKKKYFVDCTFGSDSGIKLEDAFLIDSNRLASLNYVISEYFVIPDDM